MTTLQEALEAIASALPAYIDFVPSREYLAVVHAALAQQGERKNCPQPEICGSKECEFCRDTAAPKVKGDGS